jgi:very-short-patch-repair endonuclease
VEGGHFAQQNVGVVSPTENVRATKKYMELPYNPKLKERAQELRESGNLSEALLWNQVKNKQFKNLDFDRQKIIGNYIVDFYCANHNVVIEIDGDSHDNKQEYDAVRDEYLKSLGLTVIHILDIDVKKNIDDVMAMLCNHAALLDTPRQVKPPRLSAAQKAPPPQEGNYSSRLRRDYSPPVEGGLSA